MNLAFWINAIVFAVAVMALWGVFVRSLRQKAAFGLYAVRDRLVLLIAMDLMDEDSQVFKHYYNRVNTLLGNAPRVGIDDILHTVFRQWNSADDFNVMLGKADIQAKRLFDDPAMKNAEVREAARQYYLAINRFILAHSSLLRLAYLFFTNGQHADKRLSFMLLFMTPEQRRGLLAARYTDREAADLNRPGCCPA